MSLRLCCALGGLLCLVTSVTLAGGRLYRWVDEAGGVHYTDTLPPAEADRGHSQMNKHGSVVGTTAPPKTLEEVQRDEDLKRLRDTAERARKQQEEADRILLKTFRSVDDMIMARDGRLASIDVLEQLARSNMRRQKDSLRALLAQRTDTANLGRTGTPVPQSQGDTISKTELAIQDAYSEILDREQQKQEIYASFAVDIKRFRQLKHLPEDAPGKADKGNTAPNNLVLCSSVNACERAWAQATAYVRSHATTPVHAVGANILIGDPPDGREEISLTLLRIQAKEGEGASLFLDAQCMPNPRGDTTCTSPEAKAILAGFQDAVMGPASAAPASNGTSASP
jgi:hypothetical protein